jgi:hypothetical protein
MPNLSALLPTNESMDLNGVTRTLVSPAVRPQAAQQTTRLRV